MGWLPKNSLSERHARDIVVSSALLEEEEDVFSSAHDQHSRSKSFTGPSSSTTQAGGGEEQLQLSPRRHNSVCLLRCRGTEVVDPDGVTAQLLARAGRGSLGSKAAAGGGPYHRGGGPDRSSIVSTMAVASSPPDSLGSEVPSRTGVGHDEDGQTFTHVAAAAAAGPAMMHSAGSETSRPATGASHFTRISQYSTLEGGVVPKRRRSNNFFKGDIKSSSHQLHKASIVANKQRYSKGAATRTSRDSLSSDTGSHGRQSWGSNGGGGLLPGGGGGGSSSSLGGSSQRSRHSSMLDRLRAGMSPGNIRRIISHQSGTDLLSPRMGSDGRVSVVTAATDMQSVISLGGQVLDAATLTMRDDYQRQAIQSQLGAQNLNKRVAWMNRVLGSLYVDDDMVAEEDEDDKDDVTLHPNSPFRARWDILIVLVIIYQVAVMPVRIVWGDNQIGLLFGVEMLLSLLLMADVVLSFHTGFENDGDIVMDKRRVRQQYLRGWFVPELISSLPYDILAVMAHTEDPKSYRAISFRAVRFLGLLRWPRLWRYIQKWQDLLSIDSIVLKLLKYWMALLMFVHTTGCMVALQAFLQRNNPTSFFNRTNFVSPPGDPPALMDRGPFVQYTYSLFRSTSGMLACGWGVTSPESLEELWLVLMVEFVGSMIQLVFQAAILTLVRTYDRSTANYLQRMEMVKDYFARYDIPKDIRKRAITQLLARHTNRRLMRDDFLVKDMAPSMRVDLQTHVAASILRLQPIFSTWRPVVVRAVAAELLQGIFAPGDTIFFKGEMADCMYFVAEGVVRIVDPDTGRLLTTITKGSYFGEFALLQGERGIRTASAEAVTMSLLFNLSRKTFYRIAAHYPEMVDSLNIVAAARAALNSNQAVNTEDLLRIKNMRASFLMNTCRAAVAQAILEEDEEEVEGEGEETFNANPAQG